MVQRSYTVYLKGSYTVYHCHVCESIVTLMETCKNEYFTLESYSVEVFPHNPVFANAEFIVKATGPISCDSVFDDAAETLFSMKGEFDRFRIRSYHDPHKKSDEGGDGA